MLLLPVLALAAAWSCTFPLSGGQRVEQRQAALVHTAVSRRLTVLVVLFSLLLFDGQAQVLLQQRQPSLTKRTSTTAVIDCKVEAIGNFQAAYIHWYRHIPTRAPERLLYVTSTAQINYDKDSYKDKYHSSKRGKNTCTLSVKDIREDDEGGDAQAVPVQHPAMRTSAEGGSASMACRLTKEDTVHWYKQLPGEPPKRILYVSGKKPTFDDGTDEKKYQVRKHASEPHYSLTIDYVTQRDAGTYYCAYWYFEHITALDRPR